VLGDLVKTELLVVVRPDPFGGVERAAFERGINVAAGERLRHHAEARQDLAAEAGDAHLEALQVGDGFELAAEPAAHLHPGVAAGEHHHAMLGVEIAHQLAPAAGVHPGDLLARVQAEGHRGLEGEGHVLADVVVAGGLAAFDRALADGIHDLQARDDLAAGEHADLEFAAGDLADAARQALGRAVNGIHALGEA
jgi:hypothetical protein